MSEEFFAKQESDFYWFVGVAAVIIIISLFGYFTGRNLPSQKKEIYKKKFLLANMSILVVYIFLSVPYVEFFYGYSLKKEFPKELNSTEQVARYIKDHHHRIETLENELQKAREETYMLREHYNNFLYFLMLGILTYSFSQILYPKHKNIDEIQAER